MYAFTIMKFFSQTVFPAKKAGLENSLFSCLQSAGVAGVSHVVQSQGFLTPHVLGNWVGAQHSTRVNPKVFTYTGQTLNYIHSSLF